MIVFAMIDGGTHAVDDLVDYEGNRKPFAVSNWMLSMDKKVAVGNPDTFRFNHFENLTCVS